MRRTRVYIAGRMTNGGHANGYDLHSIREAIITSNRLIELGYAPFCPQLTFLAEMIHPIPYESWLGLDFEWVAVCDVVLRLPGESRGADREVEFALSRGVDVVYSIEYLTSKWSPTQQPKHCFAENRVETPI